jgi:CheY-like chemotaxis protein
MGHDSDNKPDNSKNKKQDSQQNSMRDLLKAKELAEEASQVKSNFLNAIGHELRIPLNTILGMAQIMQSKQLNLVEQRDCSNTLFESGLELLTLINDIIDFSHSESGNLKISCAPIQLRILIEQVVNKIGHKAHTKGIRLVLDYSNEMPEEMMGDAQRLRQVLSNLIDNAIKFTDEGHIIIQVRLEKNTPPNVKYPFAKISIIDTGRGIPEENIPHLFDTHYQTPAKSFKPELRNFTNESLCSELRLALVKQIVELIGGQIEVKSKTDEGSSFSFTMPIIPILSVTNSQPTINLHNLSVLLIDDNEIPSHILQQQLTSVKMKCTTIPISNALATLHELSQNGNSYEIIIVSTQTLDHHITYLVRMIKTIAEFDDSLVVLASSTQPLDYEIEQALASGITCVLNPLQPSHFTQNLATAWQTWSEKIHFKHTNAVKHRVLLVEDNQLNQKVARIMLENLGCNIDIASNGRSALQLLENQTYDLIFMDLGLPDMSGLEVTTEFRKKEDGKHSRTPIIALTAYTLEETQQASYAAGIDDFISKPLLQDRLSAVLNHWTSEKTKKAAATTSESL